MSGDNLDHTGIWRRVDMHRDDHEHEVVAECYSSDHVGQGDLLSARRLGLAIADRAWATEENSKPWRACIWPGHEDGTQHQCDGWCEHGYADLFAALDALTVEYNRRHPDQHPVLIFPV